MERPTIKFELPATKQIVTIKEWLTGREYEDSKTPMLESIAKGETVSIIAMDHQTLKSYVISVGDKTENLVETILDLPQKDYDFIFTQINETKKKS